MTALPTTSEEAPASPAGIMYLSRTGGANASPILTLLEKIPQWEETLSSLNNTMDDRQVDLREAAKYDRENASLKRCGSMETLRPNGDSGVDGEGEDTDVAMGDEPQTNSAAPPNMTRSSTSPGPIQYNTRLRKAQAAGESAGDDKPPVLRKRKTESITSVSATPRKKWNKKEIIVYYQAPVQAAFSSIFDSIKLVGHQLDKVVRARKERGAAGRPGILDKHKYAIQSLSAYAPNTGSGAEMGALDAEMRLEADDNIDADSMLEVDSKVEVDGALPDDLEPEIVPGMKTNGTTMPALEVDDQLPDLEPDTAPHQNSTAIPSSEPDSSLPALEYRSYRKMNPNLATTSYARRLLAQQAQQSASKAGASASSGAAALSRLDNPASEAKTEPTAPDIFTELSSHLNSAADIVQEAAHQFLKLGSCKVEIQKVEALLRKLKLRVERGIKEDPTLCAPSSPIQNERAALGRFGLSKYAAFANLGVDDGELGELEAGDLEVDDGMNLEVDADESGGLAVKSVHKVAFTGTSIKSRKSTTSGKGSARGSTKRTQYTTVIKPDSLMDCSKGNDATSHSTTSADAPVTPDEHDVISSLKSERNADMMARYGVGRNTIVGRNTRLRKSMDVCEVEISPVSRVN